MKIKGLYILWPNYHYIDRCIEAGINTLIIPNQNLSFEEDQTSYREYGTYRETIELLEYYKDKDVKLLLCIIPHKYWVDLPKDQQFFDGKEYKKRTPCLYNSKDYESRIKRGSEIAKEYGADLIFDMENYANYEFEYVDSEKVSLKNHALNLNASKLKPKYKCKCERCKKRSKKNQWEIFHNQFKKHLSKDQINGQLISTSGWTFDKFPSTCNVFIEKTYPMAEYSWFSLWMKRWEIKKWVWFNKYILKRKANYIAGAWLERFTEDDFFKYLKILDRHFDGWWLYSQTALSPESPYHMIDKIKDQPKPFYNQLVGDSFFDKLSKI